MSNNDQSSTFVSNTYWSTSKPNWNDWSRVSRCRLWEAVALACDVDPVIFQPYGLTADAAVDSVLTPEPESVRNLIDIAKIAVASGTLRTIKVKISNTMQSEIELSSFTAWLQAIGYKPPDGYFWTASRLEEGSHQWPWGSYQTASLQLLAQAADKFWKNYNPHDPSTAPKNEEVKGWLEAKGMSSRMSEIVATMLRADNLPAGRR